MRGSPLHRAGTLTTIFGLAVRRRLEAVAPSCLRNFHRRLDARGHQCHFLGLREGAQKNVVATAENLQSGRP